MVRAGGRLSNKKRELLFLIQICLFVLFSTSQPGVAQSPEVRAKFMYSGIIDSCYTWPGDRTMRVALKGDTEQLTHLIADRGGDVVSRTASIVTALLPVKTLRQLVELPQVELVDMGWRKFEPPLTFVPFKMKINDSLPYTPLPIIPVTSGDWEYGVQESNMGNVVTIRSPLTKRYDGEGVLIGVIENAVLDFRHPDFLNADGTTRFVSIWDQSIAEVNQSVYGYGRFWSPEDLNREIQGETEDFRENSATWHVTAAAGVAAGSGYAAGKYCGVAPKARLVQVSVLPSATNLIEAVRYIYSVADSLGIPCVITMSYNIAQDYCDGENLSAIAISEMVGEKPGRAFITPAGNNNHFNRHYRFNLTQGSKKEIWFRCSPSLAYYASKPEYAVYKHFALVPRNAKKNVVMHFSTLLYRNEEEVRLQMKRIPESASLNVHSLLSQPTRTIAVTDPATADTLFTVKPHLHYRSDSTLGLMLAIQDKTKGGRYGSDSLATLLRVEIEGEGSYEAWNDFFLMDADYLQDSTVYPPQLHHADNENSMEAPANRENIIVAGCYWNRTEFPDVDGNLFHFEDISDSLPPFPGKLMTTTQRGNCRKLYCSPIALVPGNGLPAAIPLSLRGLDNERFPILQGGLHTVFTGTSSATPVLSGVAALFFQKNPQATSEDLQQALSETSYADSYTGPVPNDRAGYGKLDLFRLLSWKWQKEIKVEGGRR